MQKFIYVLAAAFITTGSLAAQELIVINKSITRIGHEGYPVMLKGHDGCTYAGKISSKELGVNDIHIERKFCIVGGDSVESEVSFFYQVKSVIQENALTGEKVNYLASGTELKITDFGDDASDLSCDLIKSDYQEGNTIQLQPSIEGLKKAMILYQISPQVGKCLYPEVRVRNIPVGEYEHADDASILEIRGITLTGRMEYKWGAEKLVSTVLNAADGFNVETQKLSSGQINITATKTAN